MPDIQTPAKTPYLVTLTHRRVQVCLQVVMFIYNVDKENTYKTKLRNAARQFKKQSKIAEATTEAKNTANALAAAKPGK